MLNGLYGASNINIWEHFHKNNFFLLILGKIPSVNCSEKTPIPAPSLMSLFTSPPALGASPDLPKKSKSVILDQTSSMTPKVNKNHTVGKPKFESTLGWATESSPCILRSSEKDVKTGGVTLSVSAFAASPSGLEAASPKLSKVILRGKLEAEQALDEAKKAVKPKKAPRRTILGDLKNVEKWNKVVNKANANDEEEEEEEQQQQAPAEKKAKIEKKKPKSKLLDIKGQENEPSSQKDVAAVKKAAKKQPSKKKAPPALLKGQMKMTAFLRM
jgi:hypothetical protein